MAMSQEEFHAGFERITQEMLQIAYDHADADERIQKIFIYGGNDQHQTISGAAYYLIEDKMCTVPEVDGALGRPAVSREESLALTQREGELMEQLVDLFQASGQDEPQELRMVHDCAADTMDLDLSYDPFPRGLGPMEAGRKWFNAIEDGEPPLPGH